VFYGAGLATGLLHFLDPIQLIALAGLLILLLRRPLASTLGLALILGRFSGQIALENEMNACSDRLPADSIRLSVELLEPIDSAGGRAEVAPLDAQCLGSVSARWPAGRKLPAGARVVVRARWIPREQTAVRAGGTLVVSWAGRISQTSSWSARLRNSAANASRSLYGSRAPLVDALILGRRGGIDRELQDRFAQSGLVHLLSISGFHVGVITTWIFLLGRLSRLSRARALVLAAALSVAYVGFLGWPAPATRAAALAVLLALSRIRQRQVEANSLLSATCLCVLLIDPWSILDLGGWLSAAALWGASTFTRWTDRALGPSVWWRTLGSSLGATLATAPLTAGALGTVALIGLLLNFAAIPLAAVAIPGVFASLLIWPVSSVVAGSLAGGAGLGLHLLELLARAGAAIPGGHMVVPAEPRSAVPWLGALTLGIWVSGRRNTLLEVARRLSWSAIGALWLALLWSYAPASSDTGSSLALHFLDVGQGDGAVLRTPAGHWVIVDAGPRSDRGDAGRRVVIPFLLQRGVRDLSLAFVSHAHADHLGGMASVLQRFRAGAVIEPGEQVADPLYYAFLNELASEAIPWHVGVRGEKFTLDSVTFSILHPDHSWSNWGEDINEDSLVLLVEYRGFQALLSGDAGFPAELEMRSRTRAVDLLKVGHHGSRGSTGDEWLDSLRPRAAVISVGHNNYGHPAPATLARLLRHGVALWRTDRDGTVTVTTDGHQMTIQSRGRIQSFDVQ
jgi:competence protein ComEC